MAAEPAENGPPPAVAVAAGGPNPCCAKLWKKYQKLETSRTALREAVKLLQSENDKMQKENSVLSKVCKEERLQGDSAESARATESDARDMLKKEIIELKAQNSTLQQTQNICKNDNEVLRISELEEENRRLEHVLGVERKNSNSEKKKVEEEKSKALEMTKLLKSETHKSEEYKRVADTERKVANDLRASCEKLRREANETKARLAAQIEKTEEAHKRAETEKQKSSREKKLADSEKSLAEKNKKLIEVERKKVMEEKSRGDHLFAKLEEQKKLNEDLQISIEVERKNAKDQKSRADHLFQKLEEERKRSEYLQRKSDDFSAAKDKISFGKHGRQHVDVVAESANAKLLKEKLKLKKEQLKHVKNVSKLNKAKNALIRRELQCLKEDWMQLLSRFNMLDDHLAGGVEGIHVMTEFKRQSEVHNFKQNLLHHNPVAAPYFGLQTRMVPFSSSTPREYTSYQLPRGSSTRPISGISSELEPPVGSSLRTKSKRHHRSSCPTSISDKKFMGSQGQDSLLVSSTDIRKKQSSTVTELPLKDINNTRKQDDRPLLLEVSGDSFRQKALKSSLSGGTEITDKMLSGGRKRKRTKKSLDSVASPSSKHDLLNLNTKALNATTNSLSAFNDDHSFLHQRNNIMPCVAEDDLHNCRRKCHVVADKTPSFSGPAKVPSPGARNACVGSKFASLLSFEKMIMGNCLKLLNLDNDADEEKYRKAMEAPLSPDLPIILPRINKRPICNESRHLVDGNDAECERDCPASGSDVIDSEIRSNLLEVKEPANRKSSQSGKIEPSNNKIEHADSVKALSANNKFNATVDISCSAEFVDVSTKASLHCLQYEDEAPNSVASLAEKSDNTSRSLFSGSSGSDHPNSILHLQHLCKEAPDRNSAHQICGATSDPGLKNIFGANKAQKAESINLISNSMIEHCHIAKITPICFVGAVRMKRSNIIKIFHYWEILISESRKLREDAFVDGSLLERVSAEPLLLPEEKVSLIFSLWSWDICRFTSDPVVHGNFASSAFSTTVKSYLETRWVFLKSNQLDILVSLIEDFLVDREVVVCDKIGHKNSDTSKYCHLDETGIQVSTKPAMIEQFISACILLSSICVRVERVDVVLEVSYKVLQMGKGNLSWTMLALHAFGFVCGDMFLLAKSCKFLMTTIRLVVLLLERTDTTLCLVSSYVQSNRPTAIPSCAHCMFDVDTVSVDVFISSLLDELDLCSLLWNNHANSNEIIARHSSHLVSSGLEINCGEPCNISKQAKLAEDSHNYPAGRDLCYFVEIISLLELFGSYMSCEWMYNNVTVRILKILESCTCEEYSAALLVLVSQLGRFFIDDVGYESKVVSELRNKLSVLIGTSFTRSRSIPVQFSTIGASLSLLPLTFDKIVTTQTEPLSGPCVLQARQISEWFAHLSKENQSLARSFFS